MVDLLLLLGLLQDIEVRGGQLTRVNRDPIVEVHDSAEDLNPQTSLLFVPTVAVDTLEFILALLIFNPEMYRELLVPVLWKVVAFEEVDVGFLNFAESLELDGVGTTLLLLALNCDFTADEVN